MNEHLPRVGAAAVVENRFGEILLGVRNKDPQRGKRVFPGGGIKPFESYNDAIHREVLEETGLKIELGSKIGVYEIINPPDEHRIIIFSHARVIGGNLKASSDLLSAEFFSAERIRSKMRPLLTATTERVLRDIRIL